MKDKVHIDITKRTRQKLYVLQGKLMQLEKTRSPFDEVISRALDCYATILEVEV